MDAFIVYIDYKNSIWTQIQMDENQTIICHLREIINLEEEQKHKSNEIFFWYENEKK